MTTYTHGGGFHGGALGFEYAFCAAGFKTVWVFDNNPHCQAVARRHFPDAQQLGDVFNISHPPYVDVFTAGFPCQPFSNAGSMRGADDPRYMLAQVIRIVEEAKPRVVFLENVQNFRAFDDGYHFRYLLRAIADMGYDAEWGSVSAADIGAPHLRKRWFLVAYANRERYEKLPARDTAPDAQRDDSAYQQGRRAIQYAPITGRQILGDSKSARLAQRRNRSRQNTRAYHPAATKHVYAGFARSGRAVRRQRNRVTQPRMGENVDGLSSGMDIINHRWPMGQGSDQYPYEPVRQIAGVPEQAERIQALGNAVVPQIIYHIARAIYEWLIYQDSQEK